VSVPSNMGCCYSSRQRGLLIAVEGEGSDVVSQYIASRLDRSILAKFPNKETRIGAVLQAEERREILLCSEALKLIFVANLWEKMPCVEATLKGGTHVVVVGYTLMSDGTEWAHQLQRGLLQPDVVIYIGSENVPVSNPNCHSLEVTNRSAKDICEQAFRYVVSELEKKESPLNRF